MCKQSLLWKHNVLRWAENRKPLAEQRWHICYAARMTPLEWQTDRFIRTTSCEVVQWNKFWNKKIHGQFHRHVRWGVWLWMKWCIFVCLLGWFGLWVYFFYHGLNFFKWPKNEFNSVTSQWLKNIDQGWGTCSPRAKCSPRNHLIWPASEFSLPN